MTASIVREAGESFARDNDSSHVQQVDRLYRHSRVDPRIHSVSERFASLYWLFWGLSRDTMPRSWQVRLLFLCLGSSAHGKSLL